MWEGWRFSHACLHLPLGWAGLQFLGEKRMCMLPCADFGSGLLLTILSPSNAAQPSLETWNLCIFYILKNSSKTPQRLFSLLFWTSKKLALASKISLVGSLLSWCAISWSWFRRSSQVTSHFILFFFFLIYIFKALGVSFPFCCMSSGYGDMIPCWWQWWFSVLFIRVPPLSVNYFIYFLLFCKFSLHLFFSYVFC